MHTELTLENLDDESLELLPDRDTLCQFACVNVTNIVGVNLALAVNAASINADATAFAGQALAVWLP